MSATSSDSGASSASSASSKSSESHSSSGGTVPRKSLEEVVGVDELDISLVTVSELRVLESYTIVIAIDDSASMKEKVAVKRKGEKHKTRWDELKETIEPVIRLGYSLDKDGVDVYFLNRGSVMNVTSYEKIKAKFDQKPKGGTPSITTLKRIIAEKAEAERKLLIVFATDGEPTDGSPPEKSSAQFAELLKKVTGKDIRVSILVCSDDRQTVSFLDKLDGESDSIDVVDDYETERSQIIGRGTKFFSRGDYIAKILIGAVNPKWDKLDEGKGIKLRKSSHRKGKK